MRYENPEIPEGINDSERRPLLSFLALSGAALALLGVLGVALFFLADRLTPLLPFRYETAAASGVFSSRSGDPVIEPYLRELAGRLARAQGLPEEIRSMSGIAIRSPAWGARRPSASPSCCSEPTAAANR